MLLLGELPVTSTRWLFAVLLRLLSGSGYHFRGVSLATMVNT